MSNGWFNYAEWCSMIPWRDSHQHISKPVLSLYNTQSNGWMSQHCVFKAVPIIDMTKPGWVNLPVGNLGWLGVSMMMAFPRNLSQGFLYIYNTRPCLLWYTITTAYNRKPRTPLVTSLKVMNKCFSENTLSALWLFHRKRYINHDVIKALKLSCHSFQYAII